MVKKPDCGSEDRQPALAPTPGADLCQATLPHFFTLPSDFPQPVSANPGNPGLETEP